MGEGLSALVVRDVDQLVAAIGATMTFSAWVTIDQARIDAFAAVSGDHQWVHVDPQAAEASEFGGTIAHGMLTASIATHLPVTKTLVTLKLPTRLIVNYGYDRLRFPAPVPVDSRIRSTIGLSGVTPKSDGSLEVRRLVTVDVDGAAKPAMVATVVSRLYLD